MKTWQKTREQNLVRHKSGRYYARTFNNNKEIWKSLCTAHLSVAKARPAEFLREQREKQVDGLSEASEAASNSCSSSKRSSRKTVHTMPFGKGRNGESGKRHRAKPVFAFSFDSYHLALST